MWPHQVIKGQTLACMVVAMQPSVIVEIGVFGGASLVPMAMALRETGKGIIIGIDPWEPAASVDGQTGLDAGWWAKLDHAAILRDFMAAVNTIGVGNFIRVERKRSDDVAPPASIDIFHCDGNHGPQAIRDVQRFAPNIRPGGLCVMDDLNWAGGAVRLAEQELFGLGFIMLYQLGTGAVYQKVR
jgi:predicted O-methyltransferase YrrM